MRRHLVAKRIGPGRYAFWTGQDWEPFDACAYVFQPWPRRHLRVIRKHGGLKALIRRWCWVSLSLEAATLRSKRT